MSCIHLTILLCAAAASLAAPYITNGDRVTDPEAWGWQGSLHQRFGGFVCGASLISAEWAVTAAQCVQSPPYNVRFGSLNRTEGGTFRMVIEIIVHENYTVDGDYEYNDIAVLRFLSVDVSNSTRPVQLSTTEEAGNTEGCHVTGWGFTSYPATAYPECLHQAGVFITYDSLCKGDWPNITADTQVCTFKRDVKPISTCQGDTGGPLVCEKGDHYELVGVSSFHRSDCSGLQYSVFTQVSSFRHWILETTGIE